MTLSEFIAGKQITNVWFVSHGHPTGCELIHDTNTDDPEAYCDLNDSTTLDFIADWDTLCELEGEADGDRWEWAGEGDLTDERHNTIRRIVFYAD